MLPGEVLAARRFIWLWMLVGACGACTPEAVEVDPEPRGGGGSPEECAPVESQRVGCVECLSEKCGPEVAACEGTDCACRRFGAERGQINCLLACPELRPRNEDRCARECGFGSLRESDPRTEALWVCLVNAPGGPPACGMCLPPPP